MNWQEIKKIAKEKLKPYCRVCPVCNGVACAGEVPEWEELEQVHRSRLILKH